MSVLHRILHTKFSFIIINQQAFVPVSGEVNNLATHDPTTFLIKPAKYSLHPVENENTL